MATNIDWHSHHTAPEISDRIKDLTGKRPHIDALDSPDFSKRIREMDEAGVDVQLMCQGAGVYADQLPPDQALDIVRMSNNVLAERLEGHKDRLLGVTALSLKNIAASVAEIARTAKQGFRAVLLYPHVDGKMLVDTPEMDPIFAKISELNLPIFMHGAGTAQDPTLARLEDRVGLLRADRTDHRREVFHGVGYRLTDADRDTLRPQLGGDGVGETLPVRLFVVDHGDAGCDRCRRQALTFRSCKGPTASGAIRKFSSNTFSSTAPAPMPGRCRFSSTRWARTTWCSDPTMAAGSIG